MRRILWLILVLAGVSVVYVAIQVSQGEPRKRCAILREELLGDMDKAKQVRVIEHSISWDYDPPKDVPEKIYKVAVLDAPQIAQLKAALFPSLDFGGTTFRACIFEPHHRLEITRSDGSVFKLELCFLCDELDTGDGQRIMPEGWSERLKSFVSSLGMRADGPWRITAP